MNIEIPLRRTGKCTTCGAHLRATFTRSEFESELKEPRTLAKCPTCDVWVLPAWDADLANGPDYTIRLDKGEISFDFIFDAEGFPAEEVARPEAYCLEGNCSYKAGHEGKHSWEEMR